MSMEFGGFREETMQFFLDIRFHNSKAYFDEHRKRYEQDVKAVFRAFVEALAPAMQKIDPLMEIRPHKCISRINRDIRFSRDKSPYRDHLWLCFRRAAEEKDGSVNFFFELGPTTLGWGMGTWGENKPMMEVLRRKMAADPERFMRIISSCRLEENDFVVHAATWKRMEYPPGLPLGLQGWYAMRDLYIARAHPDMNAVYDAGIVDVVRRDFEKLAPLYHMLRGAYDEAEAQ